MILVVDDDRASVEALRELLKKEGHDVVCAENGREALERLREGRKFCVILLDVMMPVMNGYEFREEQLRDPALASIPEERARVTLAVGVSSRVDGDGATGAVGPREER